MTLIDMYDLTERQGIKVLCYNMEGLESASVMARNGKCGIAIDPFSLISEKDERIKLAHELGHCTQGAFYNPYSPLDVRGRHEYRANRWAVNKIIPWKNLKSAFEDGIVDTWELAEHFDVTEDFIHTALDIYSRQGKI